MRVELKMERTHRWKWLDPRIDANVVTATPVMTTNRKLMTSLRTKCDYATNEIVNGPSWNGNSSQSSPIAFSSGCFSFYLSSFRLRCACRFVRFHEEDKLQKYQRRRCDINAKTWGLVFQHFRKLYYILLKNFKIVLRFCRVNNLRFSKFFGVSLFFLFYNLENLQCFLQILYIFT